MSIQDNLLPADLYDLAVRVKRNAGAQTYLDGIAKQLNSQLLQLPDDTDFGRVYDIHPGQTKVYEARRRTVRPSTRKTLDKDGLRKNLPALYRAAVTPKKADKKYSIYFGRNQSVWKSAQSEGAESARQTWAVKTAEVNWNRRDHMVATLFKLRADIRQREAEDKRLRIDMSHVIEERGLPTKLWVPSGEREGLMLGNIDARDYDPGVETNWDIILADPLAKPYVTYRPTGGYTTVAFMELKADPEGDPDPWEGV